MWRLATYLYEIFIKNAQVYVCKLEIYLIEGFIWNFIPCGGNDLLVN